jgi:hypothetical protein
MTGKPTVGKDVDSWCTKCKLMLAHTIEAVAGAKITRVHCNTCGSQHAYRAKPPGTTKKTKAQAAKHEERASDYEMLLRGQDPSKALPYTPSERFQPAQLIRHSAFGLGVVTSVKEGNKIEVAFPDGMKTLVHGR